MQEIIIGRDGVKNTLKVSTNGKSVNGDVVPLSVSREHCKLVINDDGTAVIYNLNPRNVTFVNGYPITVPCDIGGNDTVELGGDRYQLDLKPFKLASVVSISHLKKVWDKFKKSQEKLRISDIRRNALRSITGVFTMGAIVITVVGGENETLFIVRVILYVIAIIMILWSVISGFVNAGKRVRIEREMKERFQDRYVCPSCGMFLGFENRYDMLIRSGQCNRCRAKFRE